MELSLLENHTFALELSSWEPGESDKKETKRYSGRWSVQGRVVTLVYPGGSETLVFHPSLSFEELGLTGGAPGLVGTSDKQALVGGVKLWKQSAIRELYK